MKPSKKWENRIPFALDYKLEELKTFLSVKKSQLFKQVIEKAVMVLSITEVKDIYKKYGEKSEITNKEISKYNENGEHRVKSKSNGKSLPFQVRVKVKLSYQFDELVKNVGAKDRNSLVKAILWGVVLEPSNYYLCCPICGIPMLDKEKVVASGIGGISCENKHSSYYDFDNDIFVEVKPI